MKILQKLSQRQIVLINYCFVNKIKFKWVNEKNIKEFIDENKIAQNESAKLQYSKLKKSIC